MFRLPNGQEAVLPKLYGASAWIMGAGPSMRNLTQEERAAINTSPAIRFALNHGGRGPDGTGWIVKPTHWTAYDTTVQFSPSLFRDPSITKFVRVRRITDLVPGDGLWKLSDCPNVVSYELQDGVEHEDTFRWDSPRIWDNRDSLTTALSVAVHLGVRKLYLIGTDMKVVPSAAQQAYAANYGVTYPVIGRVEKGKFIHMPHAQRSERFSDRLSDFVTAIVNRSGKKKKDVCTELSALDREVAYSMSECKPFESTMNTDGHYHWITDHLRAARISLLKYGIELVSCTPESRLNHFLPYRSVLDVCNDMKGIGDVTAEQTLGAYVGERQIYGAPHHSDVAAYRHPAPTKPKKAGPPPEAKADDGPVKTERVVGAAERRPITFTVKQLEEGL